MKVLFVSSGNDELTFPIALHQGDLLAKYDKTLNIQHFRVRGKGVSGYLKNIRLLRKVIKDFKPEIIHSHYSFCGYLSALTFSGIPSVTSLMGSDVQQKGLLKLITRFFSLFWDIIVVKSDDMKIKCGLINAIVIPNGVDLDNFSEVSNLEAKKMLGLDSEKRYILFLADTTRPEKNFALAKEAFEKIKTNDLVLLSTNHIPHNKIKYYYYAVDLVLMTSLYEGSPNVIKEAMACNKVIVTTRVGDVEKMLSGLEGCYICSHDSGDLARSLNEGLRFKESTKGRERLIALKINSDNISAEIIKLYRSLINSQKKQILQN